MEGEIKFISANPDYCVGCKNCELGCARRRAPDEAGSQGEKQIFVTHNQDLKLPAYCRHCDDAFCLQICPTDAISRQDGVILLDQDQCTGCEMCLQACPYGVISMTTDQTNQQQVAQKCDLCYEDQLTGEQPACFAACPTAALEVETK